MGASASIRARNKHNVLSRHRGPADPATVEARQELKAAVAEEFVRRLVDEAPPLTAVQRDKLAALLGTDRAPVAREAVLQ